MALPSLSLRQTPKILPQEFKDISSFIYERTGIDIPERKKYLLETRLGSRLKELNLSSFGEYYRLLRFDASRDKELELLCEKVTTNETYFFRDPRQLDSFREHILEDVIARQMQAGKKELNIWSAGCSSGEEPYTLGIILHEVLKLTIIGWRVTITANDISRAMLAKAEQGLYNEYSLRSTPKEIIARYFTKEPAGYRIHPKVKKLVSFGHVNLNDPLSVKKVPRSHIVFCRNVIIYFDDEMKKKVVNFFYDNLHPGGYLVLGHSESIFKLTKVFKPAIKPGGILYQKQE